MSNALGVGSNAFGGVGYHTNMISHGGVVMNNYGYRQSTPDEIFRLVLRQGLGVTAVGLVVGGLASVALVGLIRSLLFGVEAAKNLFCLRGGHSGVILAQGPGVGGQGSG